MSLPADQVVGRIAKLEGWLAYLRDVWASLEAESLAHGDYGGVSGFGEDVERVYTCGRCGGRGCKFCQRGPDRVRVSEPDPYRDDVPKGVTFQEERDEGARLDNEIARLQRFARIRAGVEIREDKHLRIVRLYDRLTDREHVFLMRLERALADGADLRDLAENLAGRIPRPPREYRGVKFDGTNHRR